MMKDSFPICCL